MGAEAWHTDYPHTWYVASAREPPRRPKLDDPVTADVCVVGAGLAGLTTARELLRSGRSVVLLEARRIAWGASGRNGGFVIPGFAADVHRIIARVGLDRARVLYELSTLGADHVREQATVLGADAMMGEGFLLLARHRADADLPEYASLMGRHFSRRLDPWPRDRVREILRTDRYTAGLYDPAAFHIHPLNYALSLAGEIERTGGRIFEHTPGLAMAEAAGGHVVTTPRARVQCRQVVLCTSAGDGGLLPSLSRAVLPVATHIAVTEPLADEGHGIIRTSAAISDTRLAADYYRLLPDKRLLWGGKITTRRTPPRRLRGLMRKTMTTVYPALSETDIDYNWSGLMGYCRHRMPVIGELSPGVWAATAFGGHGLNTTAMAGVLIASAIAGGDRRWRHFSDYGPVWAGGAAGRAAVQLSYWRMRARDRWREARRAAR